MSHRISSDQITVSYRIVLNYAIVVHCRKLITVSTLVQLRVIQTLLFLRAPATDFCTFSLFLPRKAAMRNSVCLSVRLYVSLSVTRVLCDETKEYIANILISHKRVITLVF